MKAYPPDRILNVAVVGSCGSGKTSLCEALLLASGAIPRLGSVEAGNSASDFDPEEIRRRISLHASLLPLEWKEHKLNLLDTPGTIDFAGEALGVLPAVEGVAMVVDAAEGLGAGVETVWEEALRLNLARMLVLNKLDKRQADFPSRLSEARERFGKALVPLQIPVGGREFQASFSMVKPGPIPAGLGRDFETYHDMLIEATGEEDESIMRDFLEGKDIPREKIISAVRKGIEDKKITPVLCASAAMGVGVGELLDEILELFPPAAESRHAGETLRALVFKTSSEPRAGDLSFVRVYSGALRHGDTVFNLTRNHEERIGQVISVCGKTRLELPLAGAGDIAVLPKLKGAETGDLLAGRREAFELPQARLSEPMVAVSVKAKDQRDQEKMSLGLHALAREDRTLKVRYDAETRETILQGLGDLHLEVTLARLRERYGLAVDSGAPRIAYKETIKGKSQGQGKYKRQTGGHGQYGDVRLELEPLARGGGFEFVDKIFGGAIPKNYIPAVERGVREAMAGGVVAGFPVVDVRVTLTGGSYHEVDSSDLAFKIAASMAFKKVFQEAHPLLLEPVVEVRVSAPQEYMGEIAGDLNKRRGRIHSLEGDKAGALVPLAELNGYATALRSMTHGRGAYTYRFSHYQEAPSMVQERLVALHAKAREEGILDGHSGH